MVRLFKLSLILLLSSCVPMSSCLPIGNIKELIPQDKLKTSELIKTDGYYYSMEHTSIFSNSDIFSDETVWLLKFDENGYCIVLRSNVLRNKTIDQTLNDMFNRNTGEILSRSGVYEVTEKNILIQYYSITNPYHFIGKYSLFQNHGIIKENGDIELDIYKEEKLNLKFVENKDLKYRNYIQENPQKFWKRNRR